MKQAFETSFEGSGDATEVGENRTMQVDMSGNAQRASEQSFIQLVDPYVPALRRFAWTLVRNDDDADDLVQDCLERALSRWAQRRLDGSLKAWLFTILYNLRVSRWRTWVRHGGDPVSTEHWNGPVSSEADSEQRMIVLDVLSALQKLPEDQRLVITLVGVEGLSYEETASIAGVPIGTVMSRLSRGRERLRRLVEGEQNEKPRLRSVQ